MQNWAVLSIIRIEQGYAFSYQPPMVIAGQTFLQALTGQTLLKTADLAQHQTNINLAVRRMEELNQAGATDPSSANQINLEALRVAVAPPETVERGEN